MYNIYILQTRYALLSNPGVLASQKGSRHVGCPHVSVPGTLGLPPAAPAEVMSLATSAVMGTQSAMGSGWTFPSVPPSPSLALQLGLPEAMGALWV